MYRVQPTPRPPGTTRPFLGARVVVLCVVSFLVGTVIASVNAASPATSASPGASASASAAAPSASAPAAPSASAPAAPSASAPAAPSASAPTSPSASGRTFNVPSPPQSPGLIPTITTKTTTRIWGTDPFQQAVSVNQHLFPAALPSIPNTPTTPATAADRPWAVTLVTPDDPLIGISATPLIHFPDAAPLLFVTKDGIPDVTLNEIKRLGPVGIVRHNNVQAFLVGAAANAAVEAQLTAIGVKFETVTANNVFQLSNKVDMLYGSISNPDTGVPQMGTSPSVGGNGAEVVFVGSADGQSWKYYLPATHWVSHMPSALLWVHRNSIPQPTIEALKRRNGRAIIYVWGGSDQVSPAVVKALNAYGATMRIDADDAVAFNTPPTTTPFNTAVAFSKMWDPMGMVGWNILGPGHGFTLVDVDNWQGAIASAPLSHLGMHAPLLLTDSATTLPSEVEGYLSMSQPTFITTPADGPYNMTYLVGDWDELSWPLQAHIDNISEMANRRVWIQATGGRYGDGGN
jgi:hypothetical protein